MEPDLLTGIRPPYNFYKRLKEPLATPGLQEPNWTANIRMSIHNQEQNDSCDQISREDRTQILKKSEKAIQYAKNKMINGKGDGTSFFCDFHPTRIAVPNYASVSVIPLGSMYGIYTSTSDSGFPILVEQSNQWILMPEYTNVSAVLLRKFPGDLLLYSGGKWDTHLSDFLHLDRSIPLRAADSYKYADKIRVGKEEYPQRAVTAAYLYEFSNDYDNIARTAHYMAMLGLVPFDLALLCAEAIRWRIEEDRVVAYADLPAVKALPNDMQDNRPVYTKRAFPNHQEVKLWGIAPIFRQGWSFIQTEKYLDIPYRIMRIAEETSGRSATSLTNPGLAMFLKAFDYHIIETGDSFDAEIILSY